MADEKKESTSLTHLPVDIEKEVCDDCDLSTGFSTELPPRVEKTCTVGYSSDPGLNTNGSNELGIDIPDGGFHAWLQVFDAEMGVVNSFGVFQAYYESAMLNDQSPSNISWIGSIQAFLLLVVGLITGRAYDAGYFRLLVQAGTILIVFGFMMTSLCKAYWQIMLAQAVVIGIGSGFLYYPSVAILPQYFSTKKSLANGFATSGSSIGGVIYPIVFRRLEPQIGFGWTTRVIGFIVLVTSSFSLAIMKVRVPPTEKRKLWSLDALKEPTFGLVTLALFLGFAGTYIPIFYTQSYAIDEKITDENLGLCMLAILNSSSVFGRIIPNFFADKIGALNILAPTMGVAGLLAFCWTTVKNKTWMIIFALLYGFFSGTIVSLPQVLLVALSPSLNVVGTRLGTALPLAALGILIGSPVAGAIRNATDSYFGMQIFSGSMSMAALGVLIAARISKSGWKVKVKI
ncbi:MAG: hypothetical protein M1834_002700 [Cirrosporium novae-zelandiae]|nr:MAG: hypothetical protein M1834_002700 [Cirrosporium novae-zelandiae]